MEHKWNLSEKKAINEKSPDVKHQDFFCGQYQFQNI